MGKHDAQVSWLTGAVCNARAVCAGSHRPAKRAMRRLGAGAGLVLLGATTLGLVPFPGWIPELLSSLLPVLGGLGLALVGLAFWFRSRVCLLAASLTVLLVAARLAPGLWTRRLEAPAPSDQRLSLLLVNAFALNDNPDALMRVVEAQRADVTIINELSPGVMRPLRAIASDPGFSDVLLRCPPTRGEHGWIVVRSRFPASLDADPSDGVLSCILETPSGPVRLIACQLLSPRTPWRSARAQEQVDRIIGQVGLGTGPVVIAGDLNAAPTSHLSGLLSRQTMTRRTKPLLEGGTFPSGWPGFMRLGIDDALVWPGCRVVSWETVALPGSDHMGVRIELAWTSSP